MKKIVKTLLPAFALALVLSACGMRQFMDKIPRMTETEISTNPIVTNTIVIDQPSEAWGASQTTETSFDISSLIPEQEERPLVLGEPVSGNGFEITVTELSVVDDYRGKPVVKIIYKWTNNSNAVKKPYMSFVMKAVQDETDTDVYVLSDYINLGSGQIDVDPGVTVTAEHGVCITDINKPLTLELTDLSEVFGVKHTLTIENLTALK